MPQTQGHIEGRQASLLSSNFAWLSSVAFSAAACAGVPEPPTPFPAPTMPHVSEANFAEASYWSIELEPPRLLPPNLSWSPSAPAEGTLVALRIGPAPRGIPLLEIQGSSSLRTPRGIRTRELAIVPLRGGAFMAFVAAPLDALSIGIEITATLIDGSRLTLTREIPVRERRFPSTQLSVPRRFTQPDQATIERSRRERALIQATLREVSKPPLLDGPFMLPRTDVTTSVFGQRRLFNGELRSRHTGLDIDGDTGDPIYAANRGRVALARELFYNGNVVYIDHGMGLYTAYMHLSRFGVTEGEWVEKGQVIGYIGATGRVTGPHLHWGLYVQGTSLDPLSVFLLALPPAEDLFE